MSHLCPNEPRHLIILHRGQWEIVIRTFVLMRLICPWWQLVLVVCCGNEGAI